MGQNVECGRMSEIAGGKRDDKEDEGNNNDGPSHPAPYPLLEINRWR